jgi:serine phosphatase RsbU (regulator of sigma subunit)
MDAQRDPWGEERMYDLLAGLAVREAPAVCQALREAVQAFEAGAPQHDDQTIMVLEVLKRAADA